jgi:hypothetical protein
MDTNVTDKDQPISTDIAININRNTVNSNPKTRNTTRKKKKRRPYEISDDEIPRPPQEPICKYGTPIKSLNMGKDYEYSICPEGKRDWFYTLFGCFSKLYLCRYDEMYFRKVLCFRYTTDGKRCCGLYVQKDPEESMGGGYPDGYFFLNPGFLCCCYFTLDFLEPCLCCCCRLCAEEDLYGY